MDAQLYIFNEGGCHGHYLTYLIDRLSKKTPAITELPFNSLGNSHVDLPYSGFAEYVDNRDQPTTVLTGKNIIKIIYPDDVLYFERITMKRSADADRDLNTLNNDLSFLKDYKPAFYDKIQNLYGIDQNSVPRWLLRDAYKIGFLDWDKQGSVILSQERIKWFNDNFSNTNNTRFFHVGIFFDVDRLTSHLNEISQQFDLDLDLTDLAGIHKEFMARNEILQTHRNTDLVIDAVKKAIDITVPDLDILQEAYVYSVLERENDFIQMPLVDRFFERTQDILDYINFYPNHYKAMNPNLPKFNGIDNPFFLHRQKSN